MNSYQRIMALMQGEKYDQRPSSGTLSLYGARLTGCDLHKYFTDSDEFVKGQVAVVDAFSPDFLVSPICIVRETEFLGYDIKYYQNAPPNLKKRTIQSIDDVEKIILPDISTTSYNQYILSSIKKLADKYFEQVPIVAVWLDPINLLGNIVGPELLMDMMIFNTERFKLIIEKFEDYSAKYANAMLENGASFIVDFASFCNAAMITRDMAETLVYPVLERTFSKIKGGIIIHHGGNHIGSFVDLYATLTNVSGFVLDQSDDMVLAYENLLDNQVILGNISGAKLDTLLPSQIEKICHTTLEIMKDCKRYIQFSSSADIPFAASKEQIKALINAPRKKNSILGIACGIFQQEITWLVNQEKLPMEFMYLDSNLHMRPKDLQIELDKQINLNLKKYDKILLIYGDCHPYITDSYDPNKVIRVEGINCCNIFLGKAEYRKLRREGAFFVFNEWAHRWHEIFVEDIGLTKAIAPIFMNDMHTSIIYVDTGIYDIPIQLLEDMSAYFQLPYSVLKINLDQLENTIIENYEKELYND